MYNYVLKPAYGRTYNNVTELRESFYKGELFIAEGCGLLTKVVNIGDIPEKSTVKVNYGVGKSTILEVG